ncbi:LacI family DNA-binding transcriptional regulator [Aureibaculum algae]|nr:LacI family DNA-binding transcriptional regulator [Aureibaculum algae]
MYLKDIASDLNLSKTAVSLVLNNRGNENKISQKTQKRIIDYAKKHNYKPNQLARGLSRGKSETIGLIIPNISDIFYAKIASHIEKKAKLYGYTVVYSSSNENPEIESELIRSMLNRQVDGLIIASTQQNQSDIQILKDLNFPFVLIDRHYPNIETNFVIVDNFGGTKDITQHLIKNGRRKIGFITIKSNLDAIEQRLLGYQDAIKANNLEIKSENIKQLDVVDYQKEMKQAISDLVKPSVNVDAIVFSTHYLTASGLRELKLLKFKVPQQVALVSFDELGAFDLVEPPITTSKQPVLDIGNLAVEILVNDIENKNLKIENKNVLKTKLLIRKSCGI